MKLKPQNQHQPSLFDLDNPFQQLEQDLPQDLLRAVYAYCDGCLIKRFGKRNTRKNQTTNDYRKLRFDGNDYKLHRQIYTYHFGSIPKGMFIDHIDGNRHNNRIENLRLAHPDQNQWNRKINETHRSTPFKGVTINFYPQYKSPWRARFRFKSNYEYRFNKAKFFKTKTEAEAYVLSQLAVLEATRAQVHREYTNHG